MKQTFVGVAMLAALLPLASLAQPPAAGPSFSDPAAPSPRPTRIPRASISEKDPLEVPHLLGQLGDDLFACFSMDSISAGSLVYSRPEKRVFAMFSGFVSFTTEDGHSGADFSRAHSALRIVTPFSIGPDYTLAAWVKLPLPNRHGVVFQSQSGSPLYLTNDAFMCWNERGYELGHYDESLVGWHHLAVSCDGRQMALFVDGAPAGTAQVAVDGTLKTIGNHMVPSQMSTSQCSLVDDVFAFSRPLSPAEISSVMHTRIPVHTSPAFSALPPPPTPMSALEPVAPSAPSPNIADENQAATAELVKEFRNSLIFVSGDAGSGSGFVAKIAGRDLLVTNAHVAAGIQGAGFKTLEGIAIPTAAASVAVGHDIFLMQAPAGHLPFEVMKGVDENTSIGDAVVVLGNALGAGVINTITGRIVGVGPNLVEVDAPFQPGNSGSPIIHLKSKKVIGVATYLTIRKYDPATQQPIKDPVIRRFGYRIDSVKSWQPVSWRSFFAQAAEMESVEKLTADLIDFIKDVAPDARVNRDAHTNPAIRGRIDSWLATKNKHMSSTDRRTVDQNFLSFLRITCQSDIQRAQQDLTYDYFQRALAEQTKDRAMISDIFSKIIKGVQEAR